MQPVLTPQEATDLDRATQEAGTPAEVLMERAGRAVARAAVDRCGGVYGRRAVVVCGKGNNGGDGMVAARLLARWGMRVRVVAVEAVDELREPAFTNARRLHEVGIRARDFGAAALARELARSDVAIDAIFGTGFRGTPEDEWAAAIDALAASSTPVISVDIPSGVDGGTGVVQGSAVRASVTVAFGAPKVGAVLFPGAEHAGRIRIADLGFEPSAVPSGTRIVEAADVGSVLPRRRLDDHKRASGVVVVVAGSREMTGAPVLIASAAARMGAGLVVVGVPASVLPVVEAAATEPVFLSLPESAQGTISAAALEPVLTALEHADALALGPGLTRDAETAGFVRALVRGSPVPLVLDADGLSAFAGAAPDLADRKADAILTPHEGEFERLTGTGPRELARHRLDHVRALANQAGAVALLKGPRTIVAAPGGSVRINTTGGPVLATAGSGDVLTGVVAGLLARGLGPMDAASSGAFLHGDAGRDAGRRFGEGTVARDLVAALPGAVERAGRA